MKPATIVIAAFALLCACAMVPAASAHEQFTAGHYRIEVGWQDEPPIMDQPNAIAIIVTDTNLPDGANFVNDASFVPTLSTGAHSTSLATSSNPDDEPGVYRGAVIPTEAGMYTVHLVGSVNGTHMDVTTTSLEKVLSRADEAFPSSHGSLTDLQSQLTMQTYWTTGATILALVACILAAAALRRAPKGRA